ncbi:MAG: cadherin-like domain-containing protein [Acidimicrobiia bacterium]|nr:cadherin-like domain-containing protein [Acidimicrobiia bacterium]
MLTYIRALIKANINIIKRTIATLILIMISISSFVALSAKTTTPADAVESFITTSYQNTTINQRNDTLNRGGQFGTVNTRHYADTTLSYPQNVRAGQTFNYERCVRRAYLSETGIYEASIDKVTLDGVGNSFTQIYTQTSTTKDLNICKSYSATAPSAGSTTMTIPTQTVRQYGGVGYAGSCCPTWNLTWDSSTTDNTLTFSDVYTAPVAVDDGTFILQIGNSKTVSPLANDSGFTGGIGTKLGTPTAQSIPIQATNGTCTWSGNNIIYTNNGTAGYDSCQYSVNQSETDEIAPSNAAVTGTITFLASTPPIAVSDIATTNEDNPVTIDALVNDSDPDGDQISLVTVTAQAGKGTATVSNGKVVFDPNGDFEYLAVGGQEDTVLTYIINDENGLSSEGAITVTVTGRYDHVEAFNDTYNVDADETSIVIDPRTNDFADNGNPFWIRSLDTTGLLGTASMANSYITYSPNGAYDYLNDGESEVVSFTYQISDDIFPGVYSQATISITVNGVNDAPTPVDDQVSTDENTPISISPLDNDTDPDTGDTLELISATLITDRGSISIVNNNVIFDPDGDFNNVSQGSSLIAEIRYDVQDLFGNVSSASIYVTVNGLNANPIAEPDTLIVQDRQTPTIDVLVNDSDPDTDDSLSITSVTSTGSDIGTLVIENGLIRWNVGEYFLELKIGETITKTFEYTISDGHGGTSSNTGSITLSRTIANDTDNNDNGIPDWFENNYESEQNELTLIDGITTRKPLILPDSLTSCPLPNDFLKIVSGDLMAGKTIEVIGTKSWMPHSQVSYYVCSDPTLLKRVSANSDGFAATDLVLPKNLKSDTHTIVGIGISPTGEVLIQSYSVRIRGNGSLPYTGANIETLIANAFLLVLFGAILFLSKCKKRYNGEFS